MVKRRAPLPMLALTVVLGGCNELIGLELGHLDSTSATGVGGGGGGGGASPCPHTGRGPEMVAVSAEAAQPFCIDATEVTNKDYDQFAIAASSISVEQDAPCERNIIDYPIVAGAAELPVVGIDWCDARAFCTWAGKRLCGRVGGGSILDEMRNTIEDEWYLACASVALYTYPYGYSYVPGACNDSGSSPSSALAPVGEFTDCHGYEAPFDRIFDMSGNAAEWVDGPVREPEVIDWFGRYRGGSFRDVMGALRCNGWNGEKELVSSLVDTLGVRCCADAP